MSENWIIKEVNEKKRILDELDECGYLEMVKKAGEAICSALEEEHKLLIAGNGGSAADAQHFAGEIVGRFLVDRRPLPAISLCVDPSVMTCIGNDYGYEEVFARQVEGLSCQGDVFVGISTSGNSKNIIKAVSAAKEKELLTICFLGKGGGELGSLCDIPIIVPSDETPRIQELHEFTLHILCEYVDRKLFGYCQERI